MTTFKRYKEAFVWIWLPGETEPVVAGRLEAQGQTLVFNYGKSYLERENKISLFPPELPLRSGRIEPLPGLSMPGCIRDAAPDAWGRRVLLNRKLGYKGDAIQVNQFDELTYLLESGSDRIGALDFQLSPTQYEPRSLESASFDELMNAAELVERGVPLTKELGLALQHGTAIGGARPKALIDDGGKKCIAKFSSTADVYNVVKAEFIAMRLARLVGIEAAHVRLVRTMGRDVLLIERFDRVRSRRDWERKSMVSALTLFKLDEMMARYASYEDLTEIIRHGFTSASRTLDELFRRLTFNVLVGNTDDHARNHAAFWDGRMLTLTPAYDICPQPRTGNEASQAMLIHGGNRMSQIRACLEAAPNFMLTRQQALVLIEKQIGAIASNWSKVCAEAELGETEHKLFQTRQFLNPYVFENLEKDAKAVMDAARAFRDDKLV